LFFDLFILFSHISDLTVVISNRRCERYKSGRKWKDEETKPGEALKIENKAGKQKAKRFRPHFLHFTP